MEKYQVIESDLGLSIVRNNDDGSVTVIPAEPANSDYQAYLRWLNGEEEPSGTL